VPIETSLRLRIGGHIVFTPGRGGKIVRRGKNSGPLAEIYRRGGTLPGEKRKKGNERVIQVGG